MRLEFYKDYDALHKIIDHLDKSHPHDHEETTPVSPHRLPIPYRPVTGSR